MDQININNLSPQDRKLLADIGALENIQEFTAQQETGKTDNILEEENYQLEDIKLAAQQDLNVLAGMAMPTVFKCLFPIVHLAVWQLITTEVTKWRVFTKIALAIPRGHAKTTLLKLFILYCILFTERKFILVVARTASMAQNIIADVVDMLDEQNIVSTFGNWRYSLERDTLDVKKFRWKKHEGDIGRPVIIAGLGAGGSVRGLNLKNERPDVIAMDDIQDAEDAKSDVISGKLLDWMIGTLMKAKSPTGCLFIFLGNMFPGQYSILRNIKKDPTWVKFISGAILETGHAIWEALRSKAELIEEFEGDLSAGKPEIFLSEVMNDVEVSINANVDTSKLCGWKWGEFDLPQARCIIIDPAPGGAGGDDVSIGLFEIYDEIPGLRKLECGLFSPGENIVRALTMAVRHKCKVIAVESNAYQSTLLYWFNQIAQKVGIHTIHFVPIHSTNTSKNSRIVTSIRGMQNNEFGIHPEVRVQVVDQVLQFKPLRRNNTDGILDLFSMAPRVLADYGTLMSTDEADIIDASSMDITTTEGAFAF